MNWAGVCSLPDARCEISAATGDGAAAGRAGDGLPMKEGKDRGSFQWGMNACGRYDGATLLPNHGAL